MKNRPGGQCPAAPSAAKALALALGKEAALSAAPRFDSIPPLLLKPSIHGLHRRWTRDTPLALRQPATRDLSSKALARSQNELTDSR